VKINELLLWQWAEVLDTDVAGHVLVGSDLTGVVQLYEYGPAGVRQLTDLPEPIRGQYVPGGRQIVATMDAGGNERHQIYLIDADSPPGDDAEKLTSLVRDDAYAHQLLGVSPDGRQVAFVSNRRNGTDFDVFLIDLETREQRCLYDGGGWCMPPGGFSPDGRSLSLLRPGPRPLDTDALVVSVETGELTVLCEHLGEAALVGPVAWGPPGSNWAFACSNVGRDFRALVRVDIDSGSQETLVTEESDLDCFASPDGQVLLVVADQGGESQASLHRLDTNGHLVQDTCVTMPGRGVVMPWPIVGNDFSVTFTFSSPLVRGDVWRFDGTGGALVRLTTSPGLPEGTDALSAGLVEPRTLSLESFDGETIPVYLYDPPNPEPSTSQRPVVLVIHGGPESQANLMFNSFVQGLVAEGISVVVPNVRGSTGYGKRYAGLDDTTRRLDSVADLAAIHAWLPSVGLDSARAGLYGGSYGGYMVLAGCAFQPELWAAGVDVVGISDLVTFLENTSAYRRAHREREYGSLKTDREFLARASPLRSASAIKAPLFVIHGANDPRVPLSETEQLAAVLRERGVPCELLVYADEGHGLVKLANRLDAYPKAIEFLKAVLFA
jgi:dipeptidyl aminopeptidase/acylaminoacyl peptidase